jgi:type I site-specific restriction endonuclease
MTDKEHSHRTDSSTDEPATTSADTHTLPEEEIVPELEAFINELETLQDEIALGGASPHIRYMDVVHNLEWIIEYLEEVKYAVEIWDQYREWNDAGEIVERKSMHHLYQYLPLCAVIDDDERIEELVDQFPQ